MDENERLDRFERLLKHCVILVLEQVLNYKEDAMKASKQIANSGSWMSSIRRAAALFAGLGGVRPRVTGLGGVRPRVGWILGWGAALGAAAGGVAGLVIGMRTYLPTSPAAAVEGAVFGVVIGGVLACLVAGVAMLPRIRGRR
jgi:CDP-diglyceride synthetase